MADFGLLLAAMDNVLAANADDADKRALDIYLGQRERILAIRSLLDETDQWEGTPTELLERITPEKPPKGWPATPQSLGGTLTRLIPAMEQVGIKFTRDREGRSRTRKYYITRLDKDSKDSSASSAPWENSEENRTSLADDHADKCGPTDSACPHPRPHDDREIFRENGTADNADNADDVLQPFSCYGEV
jgi:hypothetical protein